MKDNKIKNTLLEGSPEAVVSKSSFAKIVSLTNSYEHNLANSNEHKSALRTETTKKIFNSFVGMTQDKSDRRAVRNSYTSKDNVSGLPIKLGNILMQHAPNLLGFSVSGMQPIPRSQATINYATFEVHNKASGVPTGLLQGSLELKTGYGSGSQATDAPAQQTMFNADTYEAKSNYEGAPDNELVMQIKSSPVEAKSRKMNAEITQEAIEDYQNGHNENLNTALFDRLTKAIVFETDRSILGTLYGTSSLGSKIDVTAFTGTGVNQLSNATQLVGEIIRRVDDLAVTANMGSKVFVIATSNVASVLMSTGNIKGGIVTESGFNSYLGKLGTTGIDVYVDRHIARAPDAQQSICIGVDDTTGTGSSVIYSPYIPLSFTETVGENTGNINIIARSRGSVVPNPYGMELGTGGKSAFSRIIEVTL